MNKLIFTNYFFFIFHYIYLFTYKFIFIKKIFIVKIKSRNKLKLRYKRGQSHRQTHFLTAEGKDCNVHLSLLRLFFFYFSGGGECNWRDEWPVAWQQKHPNKLGDT